MGASVRIQALGKSFEARRVLDSVDLELEPGSHVALQGANGSGKTTLLRILATLTRPSRGRVHVDGKDVGRQGAEVRRTVAFVADRPNLWADLTGIENVALPLRTAGVPRAQAEAQARHWLERMGLEARAQDRAGSYSRGMQQRAAMARALARSPGLLLLDEPSTGLDEEGKRILGQVLSEIQGQATIVRAEHGETGASADRLLRLVEGRVVEDA